MKKYTGMISTVLVLVILAVACEQEEEPSTSGSSDNQTIVGNWAGVSDQGFPVQMKVETWRDSFFITNYEFSYVINGDTGHLLQGDPDALGYVWADTFNFQLYHENQIKGLSKGKFWNTNYLTGMFEINELGGIYDFNYTASRIGGQVTIHSAPMYSLIYEDIQVADYTYVVGFSATHDTIRKDDQITLSSLIFSYPSPDVHRKLLEIKLGSLPEGFTNEELGQLVSVGFKSYSPNASDGVRITYWDKQENYKAWSTSFGTADQGGSLFNISELLLLSGSDSDYQLYKFTANFNCILYDAEGNSKKVVNAFYLGLIGSGSADD